MAIPCPCTACKGANSAYGRSLKTYRGPYIIWHCSVRMCVCVTVCVCVCMCVYLLFVSILRLSYAKVSPNLLEVNQMKTF